MTRPLYWIQANCVAKDFPDTGEALRNPDGLLAAGGDLMPERLRDAYQRGIFPWYSHGQPILWWAPDPRSVLFPDAVKISRSLAKKLKRAEFQVSYDRAFDEVIKACAAPRRGQAGTWITDAMIQAYNELHALGDAHSVECWHFDKLVGGLYGIAIGRVFFGESMFTRETDASKVALVGLSRYLSDWCYELIDCQVHNTHLSSLGATPIPREQFNAQLRELCVQAPAPQAWAQSPVP